MQELGRSKTWGTKNGQELDNDLLALIRRGTIRLPSLCLEFLVEESSSQIATRQTCLIGDVSLHTGVICAVYVLCIEKVQGTWKTALVKRGLVPD